MDTHALVERILAALAEKQGGDVVAYDVRGRSDITDAHILATGQNAPHLKALLNAVRLALKHEGLPCYRAAGAPGSGWLVADYVSVVVHLFNPEARRYYALDALWKDMPRLAGPRAAPGAPPS